MADVAVLGALLSQPLDLIVLGREPGDGECLEGGELGQRLVPFRDSFLELGDLGLKPFDLRCPGVRGLVRVALGLQATLELLAQVLVGAGAGGAVAVLLRVEAGPGHPRFGGQGLQVAFAAGRESPHSSRSIAARIAFSLRARSASLIRGMSLVSARCTGRRHDLVHYPLCSLHLGFQPLLLALGEAWVGQEDLAGADLTLPNSQEASDLLAVLGPRLVGIPANRIPAFLKRLRGRRFSSWQAELDAEREARQRRCGLPTDSDATSAAADGGSDTVRVPAA